MSPCRSSYAPLAHVSFLGVGVSPCFSYLCRGRLKPASRQSYWPSVVRSITAGPTTMACRFAPRPFPRSTYRGRPVTAHRRFRLAVSSYVVGAALLPGREELSCEEPAALCSFLLLLSSLSPSALLAAAAAVSGRCTTARTLAKRVVLLPGTRITSRTTSAASALVSRSQYRSSCASRPSCHHLGASHPCPSLPPSPFSASNVRSRARPVPRGIVPVAPSRAARCKPQ